jgi:hypothetical protein
VRAVARVVVKAGEAQPSSSLRSSGHVAANP